MRQAALEHPCCERAPNCWSGVAQTARDDCESVTVLSVVASATMARRPGNPFSGPMQINETSPRIDARARDTWVTQRNGEIPLPINAKATSKKLTCEW